MKITITRKLISNQISKLLNNEISVKEFGEEMFHYLAFDEEYEFEKGYETLIKDVLENFTEMHDYGGKNPGYAPDIPLKDKLLELKKQLEN